LAKFKQRSFSLTPNNTKSRLTRRNLLKGATAVGSFAAASTLGAPMLWAQNIEDITLVHTGMSGSTLAPIGKQASENLGFKIEMAVTDHPGLTNRMVNDATAVDIADMEFWQAKIMVPQGDLQAIEITKIKQWDKLLPLYTEGPFNGQEVSRQGDGLRWWISTA
jgi:putative spermidine/putrescine transport system substrate-binding protein